MIEFNYFTLLQYIIVFVLSFYIIISANNKRPIFNLREESYYVITKLYRFILGFIIFIFIITQMYNYYEKKTKQELFSILTTWTQFDNIDYSVIGNKNLWCIMFDDYTIKLNKKDNSNSIINTMYMILVHNCKNNKINNLENKIFINSMNKFIKIVKNKKPDLIFPKCIFKIIKGEKYDKN